jgi:WD40 repeat protein
MMGNHSEVPDGIAVDILLYLTSAEHAQSQCVSKTWRQTLDHAKDWSLMERAGDNGGSLTAHRKLLKIHAISATCRSNYIAVCGVESSNPSYQNVVAAAVGDNSSSHIHLLNGRRCIRTIDADPGLSAVACTSSGILVAGFRDGTARSWDVVSGRCMGRRSFAPGITCVSNLENDCIVCSTPNALFTWDPHSSDSCSIVDDEVDGGSFYAVGRAGNNEFISVSTSHRITLWDVGTRKPVHTFAQLPCSRQCKGGHTPLGENSAV